MERPAGVHELGCEPVGSRSAASAFLLVLADAASSFQLGEVMFPGVLSKILTSPVDGLDNYQEMMRLLERLEELDDVQNVYSNADIADEILEQMD